MPKVGDSFLIKEERKHYYFLSYYQTITITEVGDKIRYTYTKPALTSWSSDMPAKDWEMLSEDLIPATELIKALL